MKTVKRFTSRMLAVLLAGTLTVGGMSVSAFGAEEDSGTASEIAAEKVKEEDTVSSPADAARLLEDIGPDDAREFVMGLAPKSFTKFGNRDVGFIAQEVEELPFGDMLVDKSPNHGYDDFRNLSYDGMIAPLVRFVQDMSRRIDGLEAENAALLRRIDALESGAEGGGL